MAGQSYEILLAGTHVVINLEELKQHVSALTDEALLEVQPGDLVESARAVYEAELAARGLSWNGSSSSDADPEAAQAEDSENAAKVVSIAKFESIEEARFARTMLENEGIPVWFIGELAPEMMRGDPLAGLELVTKPEFVEQAQLVLNTEISDEELARQAEEATPESLPEDDEDSDEQSEEAEEKTGDEHQEK